MTTLLLKNTLNTQTTLSVFARILPLFILTVCFGASVMFKLSQLINHDVAWYLYSAQAYLDKGTLYKDIFWEVNPPLALYLTVLPVFLAGLIHASPIDMFILYIFFFVALSLVLVGHLLSRITGLTRLHQYSILSGMFLLLVIFPGGDFGQREHLMVIFSLPYLMLTAIHMYGGVCAWPIRTFLGIMAAIGFALKPYFLVVPIALEVYRFVKNRSFAGTIRCETVGLAFTIGMYIVIIGLFTPDYVTHVLPYARAFYNRAYETSLLAVIIRPETFFLLMTTIVYFTLRTSRTWNRFTELLLLTSGCFFVIYAFQSKGWSYQVYPVSVSMTLALISMVMAELNDLKFSGPRETTMVSHWPKLLLLITLLGTIVGHQTARGNYQNAFMTRMAPIVQHYATGSSIYIFSSSVHTGFPLVNYAGVQWSSRFPTLWLLPGLVRSQHESSVADDHELFREIEAFSIKSVVTDLSNNPPTLIIVDVARHKPFYGGVQFDYLEFFMKDPEFKNIWTRYQQIADLGDFQIYLFQPTPYTEKDIIT